MADLATLSIAVDSRPVTKAAGDLDGLTASAGRTGSSVDKLTAANQRMAAALATSNKPLIDATRYLNSMQLELEKVGKSSLQIKAMEIKLAAAAAPTAALAAEIRKTGAELLRAERNAAGFAGAGGRVAASAGAQRAGMQQLSYQIGDVTQQFALGASPMMIFAQQGGQVVQALQMMRTTSGGLIGFLAGPWGAVIMGAGMILGTLAAAHFKAADASDEQKDAAEDLINATKDLNDATRRAAQSTEASIIADINKANSLRLEAQEARKTAIAQLQLAKARQAAAGASLDSARNAQEIGGAAIMNIVANNEIKILEAEIKRQNATIKANEQTIRMSQGRLIGGYLNESYDASAAAAGKFARAQDNLNQQLAAGRITVDQYATQLNAAIQVREREEEAAQKAGRKHRERKGQLTEEQREFKRATEAAESYLKSLTTETEQIGKTAIEIKRMEVATKAAEAPTVKMAQAIRDAGAAWEEATIDKSYADATKEIDKMSKAIEGEISLLRLTGNAREMAAIDLAEEAKMAELTANALGLNADQLAELIAKWKEYYGLQRGKVQVEESLQRQREEAERLRDALGQVSGLFSDAFGVDFGGIGKSIGKAFPELSRDLKAIFEALPQNMQDVFSGFLQNLPGILATAFAGAQIGGMAGGGGTGSKIGGALGGVIGKELGSSILGPALGKLASGALGKALGSLGGPIGMLAGSLLGGVIGGLFKKTKEASATISNIGGQAAIQAIRGNNGQLKGIANTLAGGLLKGLGNIAEALGGTLGGQVRLSIGMRKDQYVVDPTGMGRTKGAGTVNFGKDEAAAVAYAMQVAIQQGVLTGVSKGAEALLKMGGDLQTQLQKALSFDKVFKDLAAEADPLKAALDELNIELNKLRDIFIEAGASAADYAALEELYARRRAKTIFEAERPRRELEIALMEATGDTARALAAQRALELEAMDASLRGLQEQVWAAQDAADANAELTASLESQAESIKSEIQSLMQEIASAVSDAENQLREVYNREVNALRELIQSFDTTANRLRDFSQSLRMMLVGPQQSLNIIRAEFERVARAARLGDMEAAGRLPEVGGALRDAVMANATSAFEAAREIAKIKLEADAAALVQDRQKTIAEQQLDELKLTVSKLIDVSENTVSVEDATKALADVQSAQNAVIADLTAAGFSNLIASTDKNSTAVERVKTATDRVAVLMAQLNDLTAQQNKLNAEQAAIAEKARQEAEARAAKALAASKEQWNALIGQGRGVASSRNVAEVNMVRQARELVADYIRFGNVQKGLNVVAPAEIARLKVWEATMPDALNRLASVSDQTIIEFAKQLAGTSTAGLRADLGSTREFINSVAEFNSAGTVFNDFVKQLSNIIAGLKDLQIRNPGVFGNIPQFADGGLHSGGLRLVGENGPELEVTGPSRIYNANQVGSMLSGGSAAEEVKALRQEMKAAMYQIAKNTSKTTEQLNRWDGDGLPETRSLVA